MINQNQQINSTINFPFKIQSFLFEAQLNKNNSVRKTNFQMNNTNNINPFFQYVNNNKSTTSLGIAPVDREQIKKINVMSQQTYRKGERKNSQVLTDPRKPPSINQPSLQVQKPVQEPKKLSAETCLQNDDLKQRRSRSRDDKLSRNREKSQQNKIQKKEEHFHKTKLCPLYEKGECKKGAQCHFAHGFKQLRGLPNFYKTRLCLSFQKGQCKKTSSQCKYAHGQGELRDLRHDAGYSNTVSQMNNGEKVKQKDDRKNFFDDKRRNNQRDSRDNRKDRNKKDRRYRQSQQSHRKDRSRKESHNRDGSYDRKKKNQKLGQNPLGYKKNIPLNKQYEKFLYADADIKVPQANTNQFKRYEDSMYMIPTGYVQPISAGYKPEMQNFNPQKQTQKISPIPYSSVNLKQNYPQYSTVNPNEFSRNLPYNYTDQKFNSKQFYQNPVQKQSQRSYSYPNPSDMSLQRSFKPQNAYGTSIGQSQPTFSNEYPPFYQPPNEFVSNFSKDLHQGYTNTKVFDQQKYVNQSNSQTVFSRDNKFSNDSMYPQGQRNLPSGGFAYEKQPQNFYKNDSFYPNSSMKKNDTNFLPSIQPGSNNYQANYPNNGVFDLYPALDNTVNPSQGQKYPYPYEKSRYSSGFSNNLPK